MPEVHAKNPGTLMLGVLETANSCVILSHFQEDKHVFYGSQVARLLAHSSLSSVREDRLEGVCQESRRAQRRLCYVYVFMDAVVKG
jgi:hypothetical protein